MATGRTDTLHVHHQHVMWLAIVRVDVVVLCRGGVVFIQRKPRECAISPAA